MAKHTSHDPLHRYRPYSARPEPPKKRKIGVYALVGVAALVFSAVWNPPTGSVHEFTQASDYRVERESGCTDSGKGCHGDESTYRSFNDYHPDAECTSCHEYQGVGCIPCHSPKNHECQVCHDGSMQQAPDRVRLTDPYPRGHYRETTHTAMGTDWDVQVRSASSGKASAGCADCHSRDLADAHLGVPETEKGEYGPEIGCGECHNDTRSRGQAEVLADWERRSCEACHRDKTSSPMHETDVADVAESTSPLKCGETGNGCHDSSDLHALHADRPRDCSTSEVKGEGCHDLELQAASPRKTSCAETRGCHPAYENDDYSHDKDREAHSPEGTAASGDDSYFGVGCGECHWMEPDGTSLVAEHLRATSSRENDPNVCRGCHNDAASEEAIAKGWAQRDSTAACSACHGSRGLDGIHGEDIAALHAAEDSAGCADTGAGCHPGAELSAVGAGAGSGDGEGPGAVGLHASCLRCHDATPTGANLAWDPSADSCGEGRECHAGAGDYDPRTSVHAGAGDVTDGGDAAHRASAAALAGRLVDALTESSTACGRCHSTALGPEHGRPSSTLAGSRLNACRGCHNASATTVRVVKGGWPSRGSAYACEECHPAPETDLAHADDGTAHEGVELAPSGVAAAGECAAIGCHATAELRTLHVDSGGCTPAGCHRSSDDIFGERKRTCGGPADGSACHAGYSATGGHEKIDMSHIGLELALTGDPQIGACSKNGCHTTVDLKRLHGDDGCGVEGCHAPSSLLLQKSCGGPDPETACHAGFTEAEHFADHSADRIGTVNGVSYGTGSNAGCFGCHLADLVGEHTSTEGAPISGEAATSCRVCHDDPEDPGNGRYAGLPAVAEAVAKRDARCVACHDSGSAAPNGIAAASAHRKISSNAALAAGDVWADPLSEWLAAFSSPMGGGHNVLGAGAVGASSAKVFPLTTYSSEDATYTWALPPNDGATAWLREDAFAGASLQDTETIRHLTIACDDCHRLPDVSGPHGSAVPIAIDPAYSQTEYANPTRGLASQFAAAGTERVVCMKCHSLEVGSVEGTTSPGGAPVHAQHDEHLGAPAHHPLRYGEKCIDCHVRIPHAWRSPRLLIRTVPGENRPADVFPYVAPGHDALAGVRLRSIDAEAGLEKRDCATGGCHGFHDPDNHPMPSDIPTATYWP